MCLDDRVSNAFSKNLLKWYDSHGRKDLPWQKNTTPYRVWISEIMLQQTQVTTVIPYYNKFIKRFPNIKTLALAAEDEVLHFWTGLGYYARARNLHKTAKIIVDEFSGRFPKDLETVITLPGIGRSTAGAILSISQDKPYAILDGNVKRVLTRYYAIEGWSGQKDIENKLWELAEKNTPEKRAADYTQAIMDLGATLCTRTKPNCSACPVRKKCQANALGLQETFPTKKLKKALPVRKTIFLIIKNPQDEILLMKRPPAGIWGGLWCFPECEDIDEWLIHNNLTKIKSKKTIKSFRHTFSHYHLDIHPELIYLKSKPKKVMESDNIIWYHPDKSDKLGFSTPVKKLLELN